VVGTPVRDAFLRNFRPAEALEPPFRLLLLGGSGGARTLNEALLEVAPALLEVAPEWEILHQTGRAEFERLKERLRHPRHALVPFITHIDEAMESASLVLSRSGASTCAELKAVGRGAVLVPLPTSASGHQRMNALALASEGRATVVEQGPEFPGRLQGVLRLLLADGEARRTLSIPREPNRAVDLCLDDLADQGV
jgi:UDP-N-acetylglucosamine--N-acetylmuramyl-(pentapeptide) pyrophosphoryl-undecaprenol N-acetylglucosamine transferase